MANGDSTRTWKRIPWWQVDLGEEVALGRLQIYNRSDGYEDRAAHVKVLLSRDGQEFKDVFTHDGTVFRGFPDQKPLVVPLHGQTARFIRLQLPGQVYFHLDEVEVFADGGETKSGTAEAGHAEQRQPVVGPAHACLRRDRLAAGRQSVACPWSAIGRGAADDWE